MIIPVFPPCATHSWTREWSRSYDMLHATPRRNHLARALLPSSSFKQHDGARTDTPSLVRSAARSPLSFQKEGKKKKLFVFLPLPSLAARAIGLGAFEYCRFAFGLLCLLVPCTQKPLALCAAFPACPTRPSPPLLRLRLQFGSVGHRRIRWFVGLVPLGKSVVALAAFACTSTSMYCMRASNCLACSGMVLTALEFALALPFLS